MPELKEIKRIFDLYCQVECTNSVKVTDLAKELGIKKTCLMQFINDNPKNFKTFTIDNSKKASENGLRVKNVYLNIQDNPDTIEWLEYTKKKYDKYIYINEWNNYGHIEGFYVNEDKGREGLWRNTKEKINKLNNLGIFSEQTFYIGSWTDCSHHKIKYALTENTLHKLKELGWIHNELTPLNEKDNT